MMDKLRSLSNKHISGRFMKKIPYLLISMILISLSLYGCYSPQAAKDGIGNYRVYTCRAKHSYERSVNVDSALAEKFLNMMKQYSDNGYFVVNRVRELRKKRCGRYNNEYILYLRKNNKSRELVTDFQGMLQSLSTAVHETAHSFSSSAFYYNDDLLISERSSNRRYVFRSTGRNTTSVYLDDWSVQHVPHTVTFPSNEITALISDRGLITSTRYKGYIYPAPPSHVTQIHGVYGLLNEYHAYYHDLCTTNGIVAKVPRKQRKVLTPQYGKNTFLIIGYNDVYMSYLQFTTYILTYFRTAKEKHPRIYSRLMNNKLLLEAFVRIERKFKKEYNRYIRLVDNKPSEMNVRDDHLNELNLPANKEMLEVIQKKVSTRHI